MRHFNTLEPTKQGVVHTLETDVSPQCTSIEENGMINRAPRMTTAVALAASVVAEVSRSDLISILGNPKYANVGPEVAAVAAGWTPWKLNADAMMRDAKSALFSLVGVDERKFLALGAERSEFEAGHVLQEYDEVGSLSSGVF